MITIINTMNKKEEGSTKTNKISSSMVFNKNCITKKKEKEK